MSTPIADVCTVRYLRIHYPAGSAHPKLIGLEERMPLAEALGLASYGIVEILDPPQPTRVVSTPAPPVPKPEPARNPGEGRFNAGGLLVIDNPKLVH